MSSSNGTTTDPQALRARMVDRIKQSGHARTLQVEDALRTVPRHQFLSDAGVPDAYSDLAVITRRGGGGGALSCASAPGVTAMMLDQLDVQPGHRVLEIGTGTGYNTALLDHLVGLSGQVVTLDADADVIAGARSVLERTGHQRVQARAHDGELGDPDSAPFDRIIVTVGAWDLPSSWYEQLVPGGRLVVALRWRGQTRSVAFLRDPDRLRAETSESCGFSPLIGQDGEQTGNIDPDGLISLHWDNDQPIRPEALAGSLARGRATVWSEVILGPDESVDGLWLHLTATEPGTCCLAAHPTAVKNRVCTPAVPARNPALIEDDSFAYLTVRRGNDDPETGEPRFELGAVGHGSARDELAERFGNHIRTWAADRDAQPTLHAYPAGNDLPAGGDRPSGLNIAKEHTRLVLAR